MSSILYLATDQGLIIGRYDTNGWQVAGNNLADIRTTSVIARGGVVLAGSKQGVYRSDDAGENWRANKLIPTNHTRRTWFYYRHINCRSDKICWT